MQLLRSRRRTICARNRDTRPERSTLTPTNPRSRRSRLAPCRRPMLSIDGLALSQIAFVLVVLVDSGCARSIASNDSAPIMSDPVDSAVRDSPVAMESCWATTGGSWARILPTAAGRLSISTDVARRADGILTSLLRVHEGLGHYVSACRQYLAPLRDSGPNVVQVVLVLPECGAISGSAWCNMTVPFYPDGAGYGALSKCSDAVLIDVDARKVYWHDEWLVAP